MLSDPERPILIGFVSLLGADDSPGLLSIAPRVSSAPRGSCISSWTKLTNLGAPPAGRMAQRSMPGNSHCRSATWTVPSAICANIHSERGRCPHRQGGPRVRAPGGDAQAPLQPDHNSRAARRKPDRRERRLFDDRSLLRARHVCRTTTAAARHPSLYETTSASSGTKGAGVGRARHPAGKDQAPRAARAPRPPSRSPSAVVSRLHLSAGRNGMVASALGAWHVWLDDGRCNTG
jgi:hypothetical protein